VRYFGWLHPCATRRRMLVENLLKKRIVVRDRTSPPPPWHLRCPQCQRFSLFVVGRLLPARAPP